MMLMVLVVVVQVSGAEYAVATASALATKHIATASNDLVPRLSKVELVMTIFFKVSHISKPWFISGLC